MARKRTPSLVSMSVPGARSCRISTLRGSTSMRPTPIVDSAGSVTYGISPCALMRLAVSRAQARSAGGQ